MPPPDRWPKSVRARIVELSRDRSTAAAIISYREETGTLVPLSTARNWIMAAQLKDAKASDVNTHPADLQQRALILLSRELRRLEKAARYKPVDLDRLDRVTRTIARIGTSKLTVPTARTLADLNSGTGWTPEIIDGAKADENA